jgi:hypothetical protein
MEIGRSVPRHQKMALLYPRSKDLQAYINEYFIVLVTFCHTMLDYAQKSTMRQYASTLSDATIKMTQSELDIWAREIEAEIRLLVAKRIEFESEEGSRFRSFANKFSKSVTHQREITAKLHILDKCSSHNHETTWKQIRKLGNTKLYAQTDEYRDWRMQSKSSTLLFRGKLGCGKSVAMANIVDDLNLFVANQDACVVYFFVQSNLPTSSKARTIIGSIARQLLQSRQSIADLTAYVDKPLDTEDMLSVLRGTFSTDCKSFVVLDGLDLCKSLDKIEVISFVYRLQQQFCVLVCTSCRQEPNIELDTTYADFQSLRVTLVPDNRLEIEEFIATELAHRLENRSLRLGDGSLILDIHDALLTGSKGMFLWVALQIESLCTLQTDAEIREALLHLPNDLSEIYRRLLQQQGLAKKYQKRIFELIIVAQQPLTTDELREALSVTPGDTTWTATKLINDVYSTLATCGCLVVIEEEELTLRFVHPSVQDFLLLCYEGASEIGMTLEECNKTMSDVIVTYLSYGVFDTALSTFRVPNIEAGNAPSKIIQSVTTGSKNAHSLALRLLAHRKRLDFDLGRQLAEHKAYQNTENKIELKFVHYARRWCMEHVSATGSRSWSMHVTKLLPLLLERSAGDPLSEPALGTAYRIAVDTNNENMLAALLQSSSAKFSNDLFPYQSQGRLYQASPMALATCKGHEQMIRMLEEAHEKGPHYTTAQLRVPTLLCHAVYKGDIDFVRAVLSGSQIDGIVSINHVCQSGRSLLSCAIWGGDIDMIQYILGESDDILMGSPNHTPVLEAVMTRNLAALDVMETSHKVFVGKDEKEKALLQARAMGFEWGIVSLNRWPLSPLQPPGTSLPPFPAPPAPPDTGLGRRDRVLGKPTGLSNYKNVN